MSSSKGRHYAGKKLLLQGISKQRYVPVGSLGGVDYPPNCSWLMTYYTVEILPVHCYLKNAQPGSEECSAGVPFTNPAESLHINAMLNFAPSLCNSEGKPSLVSL